MAAISHLMVTLRNISEDGQLKEPKCTTIINHRFKGLVNSIANSLHNTSSMFALHNDEEQQLSSIEYHINMVAISKVELYSFEKYNELNVASISLALTQIIEALELMKREVLVSESNC